jgi:thiol-disulfide isomerase/thioredoxin
MRGTCRLLSIARKIRRALLILIAVGVSASAAFAEQQAPEFTHSAMSDWINSAPQSLATLRGKPVLIEFWTFACVNCRRTLPWLKSAHARYADQELAILSVHTPELPEERVPENVREAVKRLGITYPVMLDTDFSYWNAMRNRYWPAFYLIDRRGRIAASAIGELHEGSARAHEFERQIEHAIAAH